MSNWVRIQDEFAAQNGIFYSYDADSKPLGKGGMGTVYLGYCVKDDGSGQSIFVAIKRIESDYDELLSRARQEASVQIDHPNLLRMWAYIDNVEFDESTGQGAIKHYIVMDLLDGVDLDNLISGKIQNKQGDVIPLAKELYDLYHTDRSSFIKKIMKDVLAGVGMLHSFGIVHRDLDPSNIMITSTDVGDQIKVIDYGVSKQYGQGNVTASHKTTVGSFIGKSSYAAPEVVVGDVENHNQTTDIYALGIMMYQLYTGKMPFTGNDTEVRRMHLDKDVPVEDIDDRTIRRVVKKATEKEQSNRYQSTDEMLYDLMTAASASTSVETRPAEPEKPAQSFGTQVQIQPEAEQFVPAGEVESPKEEFKAQPKKISAGIAATLLVAITVIGAAAGIFLGMYF